MKRADIFRALSFIHQKFLECKGSRRCFIVVPKPKTKMQVQNTTSLTRSYGQYLRSQAKSTTPMRFQNSPNINTFEAEVIHLRDICKLIELEFRIFAVRFGHLDVSWSDGCAQGSQLSPCECLAVCFMLEYGSENYVRNMFRMKIFKTCMRWMDDIFVIVTVATAYDDVSTDQVDKVMERSFAETLDKYSELFGMKEECADTFIGMTMIIDEQKFVQSYVEPNLNLRTTTMPAARIQNRYTGTPFPQQMAIMIGMIFRAIDCATTEEFAIRSLARLFLEALIQHYSQP